MKNFNKGMSWILAAALSMSVFTAPVFADSENYVISTPQELAALAGKEITGSIKLSSDIDMSGIQMQPIASFDGEFNGDGYKISNLTISAETSEGYMSSGAGLFAQFSGTASNVVFENPAVTLEKGNQTGVAVLAGLIPSGKSIEIKNCGVVGGYVNVESQKTTYEGAFIGNIINADAKIKNSFSTAEIKFGASKTNYNYAGGFIGYMMNADLDISDSACVSNVSAASSSGYTGGFIGIINGSNAGKSIKFTNCYYSGVLSGSFANVFGYAYSGRYAYPEVTVDNCYFDKAKNKNIDCFSSKVNCIGKVENIEDLSALDMGDAFELKDGCPLPKWYVSGQREPEEKKYSISFNINPQTAKFRLFSGEDEITSESGSYSLAAGEYSYEVSEFGYVTKKDKLTVSDDAVIDITLDECEKYGLKFNIYPTSAAAEIALTLSNDGKVMQGENGNYSLPEGVYDYSVSAEGYKAQAGTVSVPEIKEVTVKLKSGSSWDGTISETLDGEGTEENPYIIKSGSDLALAAENINGGRNAAAYYVLENDIDLGFMPWTPIGKTSVNAFSGSFDGKGHKIKGLSVSDDTVYAYYGLFGCLNNATVKNLTIGGEIFSTQSSGSVGGIAGTAAGNTLIENCANAVYISAKAGVSVGGLVGYCRKDDAIGYRWIDNSVVFKNCINNGAIVMSGEDKNQFSQGRAGGIAGYSKNCSQFENCVNLADIIGANIAAGICGEPGSAQGDNCSPYIKSCYNAGNITGKLKAYPIYGKESMSNVTNCYAAADGNKDVFYKTTDEMKTDEFAALLNGDGNAWQRDGGFPYPSNTEIPQISDALNREALKYKDVLNVPSGTETGSIFSLLKDSETADAAIRANVDGNEYFAGLSDGKVKLLKAASDKALTIGVTLILEDDDGRLRKNINVVISPDNSARQNLMNKLAAIYAAKTTPNEWAVFDMAAYSDLGLTDAKISEEAKQNYVNVAIDGLDKYYTLASDRAKAELIMGTLGIDTAELYPVNSNTPINNAEKLRNENFGSDYTTAVWALLANMQGNVNFSSSQIVKLVDILLANQKENGLFSYRYGLNTFADVDSTGWAIAALSQFTSSDTDTYGVKEKAQSFTEKAVSGLSAELGENASYGNINSDAMVITGLLAIGIDPASDERFIRNGCSLADAPMLYVNSAGNGFLSAYASGEQGEKISALATEQGFRGLVALEAFEKNNKKAYNIYAFNIKANEKPRKNPVKATGKGSIETPEEPAGTDAIKVNAEIKTPDSTWVSEETEVKEGSTVYHLLKQIADEKGIETDGLETGYVKSMTYNGETLVEFGKGQSSGWLYYVNGELPAVGITDCVLNEGDKVSFVYTVDYKQASGGGSLSGGGSSSGNKDNSNNNQTVTPPADTKWVNPFADVKENDWFFEAVKYMSDKKLLKGISETEFAPNNKLTRAMFVTILYRAENEPQADGALFADVESGSWYAKAVAWANTNGIVSGISETEFAPDTEITREQMAAIMYRYAKYKGNEVSAADEELLFDDAKSISEYAREAISWAVKNGIFTGKTEKTINPTDTATRAEAASVLMRFLNK